MNSMLHVIFSKCSPLSALCLDGHVWFTVFENEDAQCMGQHPSSCVALQVGLRKNFGKHPLLEN